MLRRVGLLLATWGSALIVLNSTAAAQSPAIYNVFSMPAGLTSLKFSNVGDPGNVADTAVMNTTSEDILNINGSPDHSTGYGAVSYNYAMGTYDVTVAQYVQFLNAVAKNGDPYGLYNPLMGGATSGPASTDPNDPIGTTAAWVTIASGSTNYPVVCGITRSGAPGNYSYALSTTAAANLSSPPIPTTNGNFPVNWDNWGDAARFCNWLENGQPTGPEGAGTTENGSYTLNGDTTVAQLFAVTKNAGATYWIPTENEWYKAAYYKTGGTNAGYWTYTTKNNTAPSSTLSATGTNNANFNSSGLQASTPWIPTPVGFYAGSPGPYGTYDQGGDVYDFTSTPVQQTSDGTGEGLYVFVMRGGSFHKSDAEELNSDYRTGADPAKYGHARSFRLATWYTTLWNGGGTGVNANNWSAASNWTGAVPTMAGGVGVAIQFGPLSGGHAANNNDLAVGTQINGISFAAGAPVYDLEGNSILLGGPVTNQTVSTQTIGLAMQLVPGGGTFNTSVGNITLTGALSGASASLIKSGTGTLTLAGNSSYSGSTSVNQGVLALGPGGSLGNTALTIGNNGSSAVLQVNGNYTIGTGGGASLAISGSTAGQGTLAFSTAESSPSTLTLSGGMTVGGNLGYPALLNFNLGSSSIDTIAASGILTVNGGGAIIGLNQLAATAILPGTYNLITFGSSSGLSGLTFAGGATSLNQNGDVFKLASTTGAEQLSVLTPPINAYWTGAQGTSSWSTLISGSNSNWGSTASGPDAGAVPGGNVTNVFFTASAAANYTSTTLDGNFSISSLTFNANAAGPFTIGPGSSSAYALTLYGSNGITVDAGAGAAAISAPLVLGSAQTWTNNSSNPLTISGSVTNAGNTLTLAGSGNLQISGVLSGTGGLVNNSSGMAILSDANTFSGQTQVSGPAALLLAASTALQNSTYSGGAANGLAFGTGVGTFILGGLSGNSGLTLSDTGGALVTLQVGNNGIGTTYAGALSGPGGLVKVGSGVLTLTGVNSYHGATGVNQGTLALGPAGSLMNTSITVGNGTSGNGVLLINGNYAIGSGNLAISGGSSATGQGAVTFNPAEINTSTLTLGGGMTLGGSSGNPGLLNFNLGNNSADTIAASGILAVNGGGGIIALNQLQGTSIASGTYNLITFGSGSGLGGLTFAGGATTISQNGDTFKLASLTGAEQLSVIAVPINAFWTGAQGASWSTLTGGDNTNWGSSTAGPDTNALPSTKTNVIFSASGASNYSSTTLDGNFGINSLTFSNSGAVGIAAGTPATSTLTIGGTSAITVSPGAGAVTISAPLVMGASQTWANNSSALLTVSGSVTNGGYALTLAGSGATSISGVIGGGGALITAGKSVVVLAGSNTYTGATTVGGGTLTLSGTGGAVNATSGVTVGLGATLLVDNRAGTNNARVPNAAGIMLNGGTFTYLGNSAASTSETVGPLTLGPGASTVAISGYGSNTSATDNATLTFGSGNSFANSLLRTAMSGSMLDVTTAIAGQGGPGFTGYPNSGGDLVLIGGLTNNGGPASINTPADWIVVNGHDIARSSGSHGLHELGIDNQQGGQIQRYFNLGAAGNPANADVLINSTSAQTGLTANTTVGSLVVQSAGAQTSILTGFTLNIANNGSGSSNPLDKNGSIIVSGSSDFTLNGGYIINGGTITSGVSGTSSELFTWIDSGTTTINSVIADIGGGATTLLAKAGSGTLILGGSNSYSAGTALDQGVLRFASGTLPHAAAGIHFDGGTLQWAPGNTQDISAGIAPIASGETAILDTNGNNVNFSTGLSGSGALAKLGGGQLSLLRASSYDGTTTVSAGTLQLGNGVAGNDGSIAGNISDNAALVFDLSGSQAYGGLINGTGSLTKLGGGVLALAGTNTYNGGTTLNGGTLAISNSNCLGAANGALLIGPATLEVAGNFTDGRNINLTDPGATIQVDSSFLYDDEGTLSGAGGLSLTGPGTLILSGSNNYTGGTDVESGTLILAANGALHDGVSLEVGANGTLIFGLPASAGPLQGSAVMALPGVAAVPEPGTVALLIAGAVVLLLNRKRR